MPPGCTEDGSGSNIVDVGTCSYDDCIRRGQGDSGKCGRRSAKLKRCCSPVSPLMKSQVSCPNGIKFNIEKVRGCECSSCAVPDIVVRGRVINEEGEALMLGEIEVKGDKKKYYTDMAGNFRFTVEAGSRRLVLNITDPYGYLQDTTKAFDLHEEQISFYTIVLQNKPSPIKFAAAQKKKIPLSAPTKPAFAAVDIPERAFVTADGKVYDGEITANVGVVDPRNEADMAAAPGDFSTTDDDGEEVMLASAGMLRQSFSDSSGNKLNLDRNISVRIDVEKLDFPDGLPVYQYYLNKETGRWVKFGVLRTEEEDVEEYVGRKKRQRKRKFFVSEITPNVPYDSINWDSPQERSYVRVVAPPGAVVTRIVGNSNNQSFISYRQETVPNSGILCIRSLLNWPAVIQAELDAAPLIPQQPSDFPQAVNPRIISRNRSSHPIQSFQFTSTIAGSKGPVYGKGEGGRCQQRKAEDLAFKFQEATSSSAESWESGREKNPRNDRVWQVLGRDICFIKAIVTGPSPESVIYVKSVGKARRGEVKSGKKIKEVLDYGYVAEKTTRVGGKGVACLEYRCNKGGRSPYQTHLQFIALTGRCNISRLSPHLEKARCNVQPDADTDTEQNFCVPDLNGNDAGLYKGKKEGKKNEAKARCLTGNNNYRIGNDELRTTDSNPAVDLYCTR